jgi:hypothetical protein
MKVGLFTYVHLDEQELLDFNLLHHYIKHYIKHNIPIKNIVIWPYGFYNYELNYKKFKDICNYYSIPIYPIENFQYDFLIAHNKFLEWQMTEGNKFEWLIKTDIDEFISYGYYKLYEYLHYMVKNEFDYASGLFIDCVDKDNKLKNVDINIDIFEQFPKRFMITKNIVNGCPHKMVLFKSNIVPNIGHHQSINNNLKIHNSKSNKVYHFKWLSNLKNRIETNKTRKIFYEFDWGKKEINNTDAIIKGDILLI